MVSVQLVNEKLSGANFNLPNYQQVQSNTTRQAQNGSGTDQKSTTNMNQLLTQFFPTNNFTARHQNLIGQNKHKKKIKSFEISNSPTRAHPGKVSGELQNPPNLKIR